MFATSKASALARILAGLMFMSITAGTASAQSRSNAEKTPPAKDAKPKDKATDTTTVTVIGQKPLNRIDRQVYDNTKDPDSKTGTALDALAKVPGVSVDPSGSVTLRGKEPTILINGRPAPQLQGDNRAAALQGMSSGSITSIEVSSNPGAQYGTGSSSSVINLITTAILPPGGFASVQAQSTGGYSLNGSAHSQFGKFSVNALLSTTDFKNDSVSSSARRSLDAHGQAQRSTQSNSQSAGDFLGNFANLSADYRVSKSDVVTAGLLYSRSSGSGGSSGNSVNYNPAGVATDIYTSIGENRNAFENQTASLTWNHTGAKLGETLKVDWRVTQGSRAFGFNNRSNYSLATVESNLAGYRTQIKSASRIGNSTFSIDYNQPVGDDQLTAGLQITSDTSTLHSNFTAPGSAALGTLTNSEYDYDQTVSAAYATYQKALGTHWTVLGGLRVEGFDLTGNALLVGLSNHVRYTTYNPSLFATYVMSETARIRLSYSHRLQRPFATDYNPQTIQTSETSVSVGQTNLKPQENNNYEIGYEFGRKGTSYSLRGYYLRETQIVTSVSTFIPDPLNLGNLVTRTGRLNAGARATTGAEFVFSGKLTPKLTVNANANFACVSLDTPNFQGAKTISGITGRIGLSYEVTKKDRLFLTGNLSAKTLDTQGFRTGYSSFGLQYNRKLPNSMQFTVAFNDLGRTNKTYTYTTTPTLDGFSVSSRPSPTFYISLQRFFGGTAKSSTARPTALNPAIGTTNRSTGTIIRY